MIAEISTRASRSRLTPERQQLAVRYMPLARSLARPLKDTHPRAWEEFDSAACLALVEAAESFDETRNIKFATFARHRINGALRDVQRDLFDRVRRTTVRAVRSEHSRRWGQHEGGSQVLGLEPDPPIGTELERRELVEVWLGRLPAKHAATCRRLYLQGMTQTEAAQSLGYSQSRLSSMHREALAMLRESRDMHERDGEAAA